MWLAGAKTGMSIDDVKGGLDFCVQCCWAFGAFLRYRGLCREACDVTMDDLKWNQTVEAVS